MTTIDLTLHPERRKRAIQRARERNIIIPTYAQMKDPAKIPAKVKEELAEIGLWDIHPRNLFRINWHNEPKASGGGFGGSTTLELPPALTGVPARIIAIVGKWFPTGAHKVGAAFSCLVPRLVTGQFDPTTQKAVWPSTGNYCRGGAYDSALLGCEFDRHPAGRHEPRALRMAGEGRRGDDQDSRAANPTSRKFSTSARNCATRART